jgi:hypothetical protein
MAFYSQDGQDKFLAKLFKNKRNEPFWILALMTAYITAIVFTSKKI